jgi:endonuclease/exonuclease/phosphatase family metal-dependent hydrolase
LEDPLCLVNTYAPSKGSKSYDDEYNELLDILAEIVIQFRDKYTVVICGDINSSLHSTNPDKMDKKLAASCLEMGLQLVPNYPQSSTFRQPAGGGESQIDYFLTTRTSVIQSVYNVPEHPSNTSDHTPVIATMSNILCKTK